LSRSNKSLLRHSDALAQVSESSTIALQNGNTELCSTLLTGPEDGYHDMVAGSMELSAAGVDVEPALMSQALRRRALRHSTIAGSGGSDLSAVDAAVSRSGVAMPKALRERMEASFGHDFSHVRLHMDGSAQAASSQLNAHAFAMGSDIYFGAGEFNLGSSATDRLLAHELTHVVQHDEGRIRGGGVSSPTDPLEREAYANESNIVSQLATYDASPGISGVEAALGPIPECVAARTEDAVSTEQSDAANQQMHAAAQALGSSSWGLGGAAMRDPKKPDTTEEAKFKVGQEVIARDGERGRRGVVIKVETEEESDATGLVSSSDGNVYTVEFVRSDGTTTGTFTPVDMREAKNQSVPDPAQAKDAPPTPDVDPKGEDKKDESAKDEVKEDKSGEGGGGPGDVPVAPSLGPVSGPVVLPASTPFIGPQLPPSVSWSQGSVSPIAIDSKLPGAKALNITNKGLVNSLNTRITDQQSVYSGLQSAVDNTFVDVTTAFQTTATGLNTNFGKSNQFSLNTTATGVDTVMTNTDTAFNQFSMANDLAATTALATLKDNATANETRLLSAKTDFPAVAVRAVDAHKMVMEAEFGLVITDLESQAKEEKGQAEDRSLTYSGGPVLADEIAGEIEASKVKEKYAKAFRKLLDAVFTDLDSKKTQQAEAWAEKMYAPELKDVWPAMDKHADLVKEKKAADKKAADTAKANWGTTVSNEKVKKDADAADHQTAVQTQETDANIGLTKKVTDTVKTTKTVQKTVADELGKRLTDEHKAVADVSTGEEAVQPTQWDLYVEVYKTRSENDHQAALDELKTVTTQSVDNVCVQVDDAKQSVATDLTNESTAVTDQQNAFTAGVQASAVTQVSTLSTQASTVQASHISATQAAQIQAAESIGRVEGEALTFLESTVKPALEVYSTSTRTQFGALATKMDTALQGAAKTGAAAEKSDRAKRAKDVWAAADYTWGTDESKMMGAVSGTSPVQAHALAHEYDQGHPHSLPWIVEDETSGHLRTSLLAWVFGNEVKAAKYAAKYGASGFFPDTATMDAALRGVSDKGRKELSKDVEYSKDISNMVGGWAVDDDVEDSIAALADMSLSKDDAELQSDTCLLQQSMNTWTGTDEAEATRILEKYGPEKAAELRAAYAKRIYENDPLNGGRSFDNLSVEEQQKQSDNTLKNDIEGDFSRGQEDQMLALSVGNMGMADAAKLKYNAQGSNDDKSAMDAINTKNLYQEDDWLDGVDATQNRANMMETMGRYENGENVGIDHAKAQMTPQGQQKAVDGWTDNEKLTNKWVGDEFGENSLMNTIITDKLSKGEADAADLMEFGVDTTGTKEAFVTEALNVIKGTADYYTRLDKLVGLGGRCATFWANESKTQHQKDMNYPGRAVARMSRLPSYLSKLDPELAGSLTGAIKSILIVLDWESGGGEQMDFELLLAEALKRDHNVTDIYEVADQTFKNMLPDHERLGAKRNGDLKDFINQTAESREKSVQGAKTAYDNGEEQSDEGQVKDTTLTLAAHIVSLEQKYTAAAGVHYDASTGFLFDHGDEAKQKATETWWTNFQASCTRVDTAAKEEEANRNKIVAVASLVVATIAGVLIAVFTAGAATGVSAALISAAITLGAAGVNMVIKFAIQGDRYSAEDVALDIMTALTDAALCFATLGMNKFAKLGAFLEKAAKEASVMNKFLANAIKSLPGELKSLLFNEDVLRGEKLDMALKQFFVGVAKGSTVGTVAEVGKGKIQGFTDAQGPAGVLLNTAIDEVTTIAGDAFTDPSKLEDPAYWIGRVQSGLLNPAATHFAQKSAIKAYNTSTVAKDDLGQLSGLPPYVLAELTAENQEVIRTLAASGDVNALSIVKKITDSGTAPKFTTDAPAEDVSTVSNGPVPGKDENEVDPSKVIDPDAKVIKVNGPPVSDGDDADLPAFGPKHPDDETLDRLIDYANGGHGPELISDYVLNLPDAKARLAALDVLEKAHDLQMNMHVSQLEPSDLDVLVQSHMIHDQAFQGSEALRKVVKLDDLKYGFDPNSAPTTQGSVGAHEGTANLSPQQKISALGLDYENSSYVTNGQKYLHPIDNLIYMDIPLTQKIRDAVKIPVDQAIMDHALKSSDPDIVLFAQTRYMVGAQKTQEMYGPHQLGKANPFTAEGATKPTKHLSMQFTIPNQEYVVPKKDAAGNNLAKPEITPGTQWFSLNGAGERVVVMTYNGPDAYAPYSMNQHLPDGPLKTQLLQLIDDATNKHGVSPIAGRY
jgi:hypothetical protein